MQMLNIAVRDDVFLSPFPVDLPGYDHVGSLLQNTRWLRSPHPEGMAQLWT